MLSYVQGVSEKITHILKHKRSKLLTNHNKPSTAYFHAPRSETFLTPRNQCNFVYYGQTERSLKTRIAEHKKAVASFDQNSKVASHVHQFSHNMNFANVKVVGVESNYHKRLLLEAWPSTVDPNAGNDHIVLPEA